MPDKTFGQSLLLQKVSQEKTINTKQHCKSNRSFSSIEIIIIKTNHLTTRDVLTLNYRVETYLLPIQYYHYYYYDVASSEIQRPSSVSDWPLFPSRLTFRKRCAVVAIVVSKGRPGSGSHDGRGASHMTILYT